jgi:nitrogen fixation protein FixH
MSKSIAAPRPLTGRMVLVMLIAFFGVVFGVNLTLAKLAIDTLPGTEVDSAYSASLAYEGEIAAARKQNERGWKIEAHVERATDGVANILVNARDSQGSPLAGLAFSSRLERPTDRRGDREANLVEAESAVYRGKVADVAPGQWDLVLEGDASGRRVFLSKSRIILK